MKNVFVLLLVTSAMLFAGCNHPPVEDTIVCIQLDPLKKVFTEESYFVENPDTAAVAKGETATFQFVFKCAYPIQDLKVEPQHLVCGDQQIAATLKAFVGYTRAGTHTGVHLPSSRDAVFPVSDLYPDCLQEVETINVQPMQNQPVWVSYAIPRDATAGDYSATLVFSGKVNGKPFRIAKQVNAKVYPVTLPEQTLWVTNWWTPSGFAKMNGNQPVELYSDRHWELLTQMAHVMRDHGQNTYIIWEEGCGDPFFFGNLVRAELTGAQYTFDFTNFDKTVEIFIREGGLKRIEGGHLGRRFPHDTRWTLDYGIGVPNVGLMSFENDTVQNFLSQFLPALYNHLATKGWKDMYVQHIADEPNDGNAALSYIRIAEFVKKHMPGIPIIDALHTHKVANTVNIWVPMLDIYHKDYPFFQERKAVDDEVWFYTCTQPQGNYANRFLEQPLIQTRFLHWLNYRFGATGFLHWGYNWWNDNPVAEAALNSDWPAGDAWIVYPADGKFHSSIRLAAMRDGIADYELLKLLEEKAPAKAKELANETIYDFDRYNNNIRIFRQTRLKLLKWLSE